MKQSRISISQMCATAALLLTAPAFAAESYALIDLGLYTAASSINDNGVISGAITVSGSYQAARWSQNAWTTLENLSTPGTGFALQTNSAGTTIGMANGQAVTWGADGKQLGTLSTLPGSTWTRPVGINDQGDAIGQSSNGAVLWHNGQVSELTRPDGATDTIAMGINQTGAIAGYSIAANGLPQAVIWQNNAATVLSNPDGFPETNDDNHAYSRVFGLNNVGAAVGYVSEYFWDMPTLWVNGKAQILPTLGGGQGLAYSVNDAGQVVGYSQTNNQYATLWDNGQAFDLKSLTINGQDWQLSQAYAINKLGQIVGTGSLNGQTHAFLLNPLSMAPEANTTAMALLGLTLVCRPMKRRKTPHKA